MDSVVVAIAAVFGLVIGSFLNVVIVRLQLEDPGERSIRGRSRCPSCGQPIAAWDNVPVVSWLLLRGRCRRCKARISARYPLVEVLTAALFAAVAAHAPDWPTLVSGIVFMSLLVPLTFIDLDCFRLPNALTYPGIVLGLALGIGLGPQPRFVADDLWWLEVLLAAAGAFLFLFIAWFAYPRGMGLGDVKLAGMMGAFLGAPVAIALFSGFVLGLVPSLWLLATRGMRARKIAIPFGPFLCGGAVIGWFFGPDLLAWYLDVGLR